MTTVRSTSDVGLFLPGNNLDFIRAAALVAILLQYTYIFAFNTAPESVRTAFAGALLAIHVALAALLVLMHEYYRARMVSRLVAWPTDGIAYTASPRNETNDGAAR